MKKFTLTLLCLLMVNLIIAQSDTTDRGCSTPDIDTTEFQQLPRFDNNQFLENLLDSFGYPAAGAASRIVADSSQETPTLSSIELTKLYWHSLPFLQ